MGFHVLRGIVPKQATEKELRMGAVVKRTANSIVAKGTDIENTKDLFKHVGEKVSNVKLYFIDNAQLLFRGLLRYNST
jgi:hypothetical protein